MPELPEVETIRRDLNAKIIGQKITAVEISAPRIVRPTLKKFKNTLIDASILSIDRIGKLLIATLDKKDIFLLIHLKMTGQLIYRDRNTIIAGGHSLFAQKFAHLPDRHTRVIFYFPNDAVLFFNDLRLFGYLQLVTSEELKIIKEKYGIEPLQKNFTLENFSAVLKNKTTSLKALLLNQKLIAGIGNIYADEICFAAGIRPMRPAKNLTGTEIKRLHSVCEKIIAKGIKHRGTTFNTFVDTAGQSGGFLRFLQVYGRGKLKCKKCPATILKIKIAGRGTHYCYRCQK